MRGPKRRGGLHEYIRFFVIFFLLISTGCATKEALKNASDEEELKARVMSYWNLKINGEFDKSYEYEDPFYRKTVSVVKYVKGVNTSAVKWRHAEIRDIKRVAGDMADVDLSLRVEIMLPEGEQARRIERNFPVSDKWIKVDGVWYHQPSRRGQR
ncbi:MAG: hypothetical protein M0Z67_05170 [Nitrospiraceae bacterium]|nr:hypothetical protein [Nitrospiraceae bacterium]